jgi:hypothetical protein
MKITKRQLRRIIREEKQKLIVEVSQNMEDNPEIMDLFNQILQVFARQFPGIDTSYFGDEIYQALENEWKAAAAEEAESGSDF